MELRWLLWPGWSLPRVVVADFVIISLFFFPAKLLQTIPSSYLSAKDLSMDLDLESWVIPAKSVLESELWLQKCTPIGCLDGIVSQSPSWPTPVSWPWLWLRLFI